jgi:NDP-sugar pyrophosphorylase family protein
MAFEQPTRAFISGAGPGTRLRPHTERLPKPLLPVKGKPLVYHILQHLAATGIDQAVINTHHAAVRWQEAFPDGKAEGVEVFLRHEASLLDTGGGLKNVQDLFVAYGTFVIHDGHIWTSLPIAKAIDHHRQARNLVTLVLRSGGGPLDVAFDPQNNRVLNIGSQTPGARTHIFTGIQVVEPKIFEHMPHRQPHTFLSVLQKLIQENLRVGGIVIDEGDWTSIETLADYERVK